jgi:hypothetical protein
VVFLEVSAVPAGELQPIHELEGLDHGRNRMTRFIAGSLIALLAAGTSFAQDEKQGEGRRKRGQGGQRGEGGQGGRGGFQGGIGGFGGGGMMFGGMSGTYIQILEMKEVQDDLKLSADEKGNIPLLKDEFAEGDKKLGEEMRGGNVDREAIGEKINARRAEIQKQLKEVLGDKYTRFNQIKLQLDGLYGAVTRDKEVQDALSVTEDQRTQLREAMRPAGGEGGRRFDFGGGPPSEEKMKELRDEMAKRQNEALDKVLTADQKKKWEDMIGPKIAYKRPEPKMDMTRFGGGRGNRRPGGSEGGNTPPPADTPAVKKTETKETVPPPVKDGV